MTHRLLAVLLSLLLFALALVLAACSSDSTSSSDNSPSPSPSATSSAVSTAVCDSLTALRDDVKAMAGAGSVAEFQSAYTAAKQDFADLKPAASAAYGPDVDALQSALDDFGTALQQAGQGSPGSGLQQVGTAAVQVGAAVNKLATDLPCPSTSG